MFDGLTPSCKTSTDLVCIFTSHRCFVHSDSWQNAYAHRQNDVAGYGRAPEMYGSRSHGRLASLIRSGQRVICGLMTCLKWLAHVKNVAVVNRLRNLWLDISRPNRTKSSNTIVSVVNGKSYAKYRHGFFYLMRCNVRTGKSVLVKWLTHHACPN